MKSKNGGVAAVECSCVYCALARTQARPFLTEQVFCFWTRGRSVYSSRKLSGSVTQPEVMKKYLPPGGTHCERRGPSSARTSTLLSYPPSTRSLWSSFGAKILNVVACLYIGACIAAVIRGYGRCLLQRLDPRRPMKIRWMEEKYHHHRTTVAERILAGRVSVRILCEGRERGTETWI